MSAAVELQKVKPRQDLDQTLKESLTASCCSLEKLAAKAK